MIGDRWPVDPNAPRELALYLADGPLGPAFVSKRIVEPSGRTNIVTDDVGAAHQYTVFHVTRDVMFFAHDPTGELATAVRR